MNRFCSRAALAGLAAICLTTAWAASDPALPASVPGYVARRTCSVPSRDTLKIDTRGLPVRFSRAGQPLSEGAGYRISGDTAFVFPAAAASGVRDTLCVTRYVSPVLPEPRQRLYAPERVPVLRATTGAGDSALPKPGGLPGEAAASVTSDTGGYELALSGSKSVAVTAGGGGALGVDAALFLNVNGQIADNVWIEGTLSDQNTPVQPEGNTTTLREVDVKYLRVYGRQYEYLLGDYFLRHGREGEDLYSIQAEGARLRYGQNGYSGSVAFARSKGLFRSDTLRGADGKQRGYYLRGKDGRTFITVLAGTERIRRNGVALQRGVDYAIDYAQGRVDFLSGVSVTGENLFTVEFQYVEDTYPRIVFAGEAADTIGAFRFGVRAIQEAEDERNPATGTPDAATLASYSAAGDLPVTDSLGNRVDMPGRRAATVFTGEWEGGEAGHASFSVLGSLLDRNLYSSRDDDDNLGWSTRYSGTHRFGAPLDKGGVSRVIVEPEHEHRSRDYAAFGQIVEPRGFRDIWNLDASVGERDFDANRLRLSLEPFTGWSLGGGAGYAAGHLRDTVDTAAASGPAATSLRGEAFTKWEKGASRVELAAESKRAKDPLRRDNDRQRASAEWNWNGWLPRFEATRDDWTTDRAAGVTARSELWQPRLAVESPALFDRWTWSPEVDALYGRSNYEGNEVSPQDSLIDIGLAQRLRLLGWGPVTGDVYAARRRQRVWLPDVNGDRALEAQNATYDQAEANLSVSDYLHGYGANMHYRAARTAETPLIESYEKVAAGRGDYAYDSLLNDYYRVETGGDYVLAGLARDTTLGQQPYQDLQWSLRVDLSPGKWPAGLGIGGGILADVDLSLDIETDHQDSASDPLPLPRFTDRQIDAVRSGRARYEPSARWADPDGGRSASLVYRREYAKGAGTQAFRERDSETRGEYRHEWSEVWEGAWVGTLDSRWRQGLVTGSSASRSEAQSAQMLVYRRLPHAFTLIPSLEYRRAAGEDAGLPLELQGVVPRA
ncbi:MAG TPA: hypothetical protein VHO02_01440, partial [Fibrobacteria bacterium]|nr:hypothetical protein [Fibrobacteria bacterium]